MSEPIIETLGQRIKRLRIEAGYPTQDTFSRLSGINRTSITHWESGRSRPRTPNLKKLGRFFGVSAVYILSGIDPEELPKAIERKAEDRLKNLKSAIMRACIARRSLTEIQRIVSDA